MTKSFRLLNLDCASCASKLEKALKKIKKTKNVTVNFLTTKLVLEADDNDMDEVLKEAFEIIKKEQPFVDVRKA